MSALTRFPQAAGRRYQVTSEEDARQAFRWLCEDHAETLDRIQAAKTETARARWRADLARIETETAAIVEEWF